MLTSKLESKRWELIFTPRLTDDEWQRLADAGFWDEIFDLTLRGGKGDYSVRRAITYLPQYLKAMGITIAIVDVRDKKGRDKRNGEELKGMKREGKG